MKIEIFEKKLRDIFIHKGWNNACRHWFSIETHSGYKFKYIRIVRIETNEIIWEDDEAYWDVLFKNALKAVKQEWDKDEYEGYPKDI